MSFLAGKTAVVTGGATGIGAAIVSLFAAEGAGGTVIDVAAVDGCPGGWRCVLADVRDDAALAAALDSVGDNRRPRRRGGNRAAVEQHRHARSRRGIRVNAVAPGPIATHAMLARHRRRAEAGGMPVEEALAAAATVTTLGRIANVDDVARAVLFPASDLSSATTGHLLPVDGGIP